MGWSVCPLESIECLEQLRVLYNGGRIHMSLSQAVIHSGVDTEEQLAHVEKILSKSCKTV